jgi:Asp-tRNA(Asn)/Glu-tRNA(Gln) amidotransferase A subunit family amidase
LRTSAPLARNVRDAALLLQAVAGYDPRDPGAIAGPVPDFLAACDAPVQGLRIAWSPTLGYAEPEPEVVEICARAARLLEGAGCVVEEVERVFAADPEDLWMAEFYAGAGGSGLSSSLGVTCSIRPSPRFWTLRSRRTCAAIMIRSSGVTRCATRCSPSSDATTRC